MTDQDPVDDLLHAAFAADYERTPAVTVTERVVARIRRHRRIRRVTLGGAVLAGATLLAALAPPATGALDEAVRQLVSAEWAGQGLAAALLAVIGSSWLVLLDSESA